MINVSATHAFRLSYRVWQMPTGYRPIPSDPDTPRSAVETHDRSPRDGDYTEDPTGTAHLSIPEIREQDAHVGVKKVQAALRIYGPYSRWSLFIGLGLASYIYSLDGSTTSSYLAFATSSFGEHSLLSSVSVAQSLILAIGKPVIAKVADVSSRGRAYVAVLLFYVLGYIVIASAPNVGTIAGGIILYAIGYTGLQILLQIIVADITTLKWRGLVSSLVSAPFLVNAFIGSNISTAVIEHVGWRWGYGMFAILLPVSLFPLIITLLWAEYKAKKLGLVSNDSQNVRDDAAPLYDVPLQRLRRAAAKLDLVGLVLLGTAVSLILLPLTLSQTAKGQWKNGSMISMLVIGVVLLFVFVYWDFRVATRPVIAPRFLKNRSVIFAAMIGFFDFISFYLTFAYLFSFVLIVKPWSLINATYFMQTQTVALTLFGILAGVCLRLMRRYKYVLVFGLVMRLVGVALMIHSRGANGSDVEIVFTQILQGFGGGLAAVTAQVGAQAAVPHADVAIITALVLLFTEIGGGVGNACAGAIWSNTMPGNLEKYLPSLTDEERAQLYGSITSVMSYPPGSPVREGVILAYDDTMKVMILCAIGCSVVPILCALGMPNWRLGDKQNAVDSEDLTGRDSTGRKDDDAVDEA